MTPAIADEASGLEFACGVRDAFASDAEHAGDQLLCHTQFARTNFAQASPRSPSSRIRTLVVDDAQTLADALVLLLDAEGIEAQAAYGGQHALTLMPSFLPDVVLLDLHMPDVDGWQVAQTIGTLPKERRPAVIIHTNLDLESSTLKDLQCDRLIRKTSEIDRLAELLFSAAGDAVARRTASGR